MKPDKLLYHYTDINAAMSIMRSGVLYFTHHKKMNDPTEFFHADELLHSSAEQAFNEIFKQDRKLSVSLKGRKYEQVLEYDSKVIIKALSSQLSNDYYIFSSTQHVDKYDMENGSLVMWRGYGKENGCAIVFDKEKLIAAADDLPKNGRAYCTNDGKVHYLRKPEEMCSKFADEYRVFVDYLKCTATLHLNQEKPLYDQVDGLNPYIKMKALTKHHAYESENEFRLTILRSIPNINGTDRNLISVENGTIKLPITTNGLPIKKIIVSPFFNQDKNYKILEDFVKSRPEYLNISIKKSKIPHA